MTAVTQGNLMVPPDKEYRQKMPSELWGRSDRTWSEELVQREVRSVSQRLKYPRFRSYLAPPAATFLPPLRGSS